MTKYIELMNWTDQGIRNVKNSPSRLDAAKATAKKFGCEIEQFFMTIGPYDGVVVVEAPDDDAVAKYTLSLGAMSAQRHSRHFRKHRFERSLVHCRKVSLKRLADG
jgi:uncharacterized protein with GYD domain